MCAATPEPLLPARPTLEYEETFWRHGFSLVAGVDEVGRGALAGPLVAAAVVLPGEWGGDRLIGELDGVNDSKLLDATTRAALDQRVRLVARYFAFGIVEAPELDLVGVSAANRLAMERAVDGLGIDVHAMLLDARVIEHTAPQVGLIKGDRRSLSIAAAAILAKVARDCMMIDHHDRDDRYAFDRHKGYGTAAHLAALRRYGPCHLHRRTFAWDTGA